MAERWFFMSNVLVVAINTTYPAAEKYARNKGREFDWRYVYDCARGGWGVAENRLFEIDYVIAVYDGDPKGVFEPTEWYNDKDRIEEAFKDCPWRSKPTDWCFEGNQVPYEPKGKKIEEKYYEIKPKLTRKCFTYIQIDL
jgi:hypothetical protein